MHTTLEVAEGRLVFTYQPPGEHARVLIISLDGGGGSLNVGEAWEMEESDEETHEDTAVSTFLACMCATIPVLWTTLHHSIPHKAVGHMQDIVEDCFVDTEQELFK